jgi:hypothetical protein
MTLEAQLRDVGIIPVVALDGAEAANASEQMRPYSRR